MRKNPRVKRQSSKIAENRDYELTSYKKVVINLIPRGQVYERIVNEAQARKPRNGKENYFSKI